MNMLEPGDKFPQFSLKNQHGKDFDLESIIGKKAFVLFFYPKNFTPGCIKEVCSFRDHFQLFTDHGIEVIGVSSDSEQSHQKFIKKYNLPFTLLIDDNGAARKLLGVKSKFFGLLPGRVTFVVDKSGKILLVFNDQLNSKRHVSEALQILEIPIK